MDIEKFKKILADRILDHEARPFSTMTNYYNNLNEMLAAPKSETSDKYFHAKANCQSGQYYDTLYTPLLNIGKEIYDIYKKNIYPKNDKTAKENLLDSKNDLNADSYGLLQGLLNPFGDCRELLDIYKPDNLKGKY